MSLLSIHTIYMKLNSIKLTSNLGRQVYKMFILNNVENESIYILVMIVEKRDLIEKSTYIITNFIRYKKFFFVRIVLICNTLSYLY